MPAFFSSETTRMIYLNLGGRDRDNFLGQKIFDKLKDPDYWKGSRSALQVTDAQVQIVLRNLA